MTKETSHAIPGRTEGIELLEQLRPYVRHCGAPRRPAWHIGSRRLLDYLLVYIEEGTGRFVIDDTEYDVQPGDLYWIPPDTPHEMQGHPPSMVCPYVHFDLLYRPTASHWDFSIPHVFDIDQVRPLLHPPIRDERINALRGRLRSSTNRRVCVLIRSICAEAARAQPHAMLCMSGLMLQIVGEILRGRQGGRTEDHEHVPLLEEAERYLRDHCGEAVSVEQLADLAGLSVSHFRQLFGAHFGRSPRTHLRHLRINRAKELMSGSDLTLGEVADQCGFATVHSLSRAFRAVEGIPPSQYRRFGPVSTRVEGRSTPYPGAE
jgi:AraC-like DNA-binding protein